MVTRSTSIRLDRHPNVLVGTIAAAYIATLEKRGGGVRAASLDEALEVSAEDAGWVLELDSALLELAEEVVIRGHQYSSGSRIVRA